MKKFTYKEAALLLGYTHRYVRTLVEKGKLGWKFTEPGAGYEITQDDIDGYEHPVMGRPSGIGNSKLPSGQFLRQMMNGAWTAKELAKLYDVTTNAVFKRIAKAKREAKKREQLP